MLQFYVFIVKVTILEVHAYFSSCIPLVSVKFLCSSPKPKEFSSLSICYVVQSKQCNISTEFLSDWCWCYPCNLKCLWVQSRNDRQVLNNSYVQWTQCIRQKGLLVKELGLMFILFLILMPTILSMIFVICI